MRPRSHLFILIALILLGVGLFVLRSQNQKAANQNVLPSFAIENPDDVTLIFMTNQTGDKQIYLKKQSDGTWTVNDSFVASQSKVRFLLEETMSNLHTDGPAPKAAFDNIISYMSINGIKVEAYTGGDQPEMVYIIGNTTPNQLGTYYKKPGDETPYIVDLQGFNGFLNVRYELEEDRWISRTVFSSIKEQIDSVSVEYPEASRSFKMIQPEIGTFVTASEIIKENNKNTGAIRSYFTLFEKLNFETFVFTESDSLYNALNAAQPFCTITVNSKNRGKDELKFFKKDAYEKMHGLYDENGNPLVNDPSRYYALYNKLNRVLIVQDYTFGKVMKEAKDFTNRIEM